MDLREYAQAFDEAERDFEAAVEAYGLAFEPAESSPRTARGPAARASGCACENGGASLWRNWISPACVACRKGEGTATFFVDLRCTRNCYFCFNPNQAFYDYYRSNERDIVAELEQAHAVGLRFSCLAVTGGEPLLHQDQVEAFLSRAQELYPGVHTRLYTCGDLLDERGLRRLAESGLSEIRFSVKPPDSDDDQDGQGRQGRQDGQGRRDRQGRQGRQDGQGSRDRQGRQGCEGCHDRRDRQSRQDRVYELMEQAVGTIPSVMVEVPAIPGGVGQMEELLLRSDAIGIRGVNLLEFCFPLHRAAEFRKRGFKLRKRPYKYLYDYWYGGGVPLAGSEDAALELLEFSRRAGLKMGVHYCSSDNKNSGQIYQQNKAFLADAALRDAHPWLRADENDFFLKCTKAFGSDAQLVRSWADALGTVPYGFDPSVPSVAFPSEHVPALRKALPGVAFGESVNVVEQREAPEAAGEPAREAGAAASSGAPELHEEGVGEGGSGGEGRGGRARAASRFAVREVALVELASGVGEAEAGAGRSE